jgi:pilus assembly protein CpaB
LREVPWPANALPAGAFGKIDDVLSEGRRVALTAIEPNEPVLSTKITGPGQRATLSAMLRDGLKAVTVRVNDVDGVGGFVLPGDFVDVVCTRQVDKTAASSDVVLQNVRVLAVDQIADERAEKPIVVKAVTIEVDMIGAQKITLAASIGAISLMLRKAGEMEAEATRRVSLGDLLGAESSLPKNMKFKTIRVHRPAKTDDYSVPAENGRGQAFAGVQ